MINRVVAIIYTISSVIYAEEKSFLDEPGVTVFSSPESLFKIGESSVLEDDFIYFE